MERKERNRQENKYSYDALLKKNTVTVKGKNLTAKLMKERFPKVTGRTPWVYDTNTHPLDWRRKGVPSGEPIYKQGAYGDAAPLRVFADARHMFDTTFFEDMPREAAEYFNRPDHWEVPSMGQSLEGVTASTHLEDGSYGYLVHLNKGRAELNNPPVGRSRYQRADGFKFIWGDPRLDEPYWRECGDNLFFYTDRDKAIREFQTMRLMLDAFNQEIRLYQLTRELDLGQAREWLNLDQPLNMRMHGAHTAMHWGVGQYGMLNRARLSQQVNPEADELDRIAEQEYLNSLSEQETKELEEKLAWGEIWWAEEPERLELNRQRIKALKENELLEKFFNVREFFKESLEHHRIAAASGDEDEQALLEIGQRFLDEDDIESMVSEVEDRYILFGMEEYIRRANLISPEETYAVLGRQLPLREQDIEAAYRHNKAVALRGEEESLDWSYWKQRNPQNRPLEVMTYARENMVAAHREFGLEQAVDMAQQLLDPELSPASKVLGASEFDNKGGYTWENTNMQDYAQGLLPGCMPECYPDGVFKPAHDRIEYLLMLLEGGYITLERFWQRVQDDSYFMDHPEFFEDGDSPLVITKKNWKSFGWIQDPSLVEVGGLRCGDHYPLHLIDEEGNMTDGYGGLITGDEESGFVTKTLPEREEPFASVEEEDEYLHGDPFFTSDVLSELAWDNGLNPTWARVSEWEKLMDSLPEDWFKSCAGDRAVALEKERLAPEIMDWYRACQEQKEEEAAERARYEAAHPVLDASAMDFLPAA